MSDKQIFVGFSSFSNSEVSPEEVGTASDVRRSPGQHPPPPSGEGSEGAAAQALYLQGEERSPSKPSPGRGSSICHALRPAPRPQAAAGHHVLAVAALRRSGVVLCSEFQELPQPPYLWRSYLGPGCARQPRALLFLTGCNMGWGFPSLGIHILVLTLQEASVNSLSVFVVT